MNQSINESMNDKAVYRTARDKPGRLNIVEEVSMKWMDKPSVTEIERGGVYEMDKVPKKLNANK